MNDRFFWLTPHMKKIEKSRNFKQFILMNFQNIRFGEPFFLKEYNLFSQNIESSIEQ